MIDYVGQKNAGAPAAENRNGAMAQSSYLEFLPAFYRDNEFMGQFLMIFESILKPIENTVNNIPLYFDPRISPEELLPWLGSWLDLALDATLPLSRRRQLVASAAELYRWRGTKRGLIEYLRICTGVVPAVSEHIAGMRLTPETRLGVDTQLGSSGTGHHFTVVMKVTGSDGVSAGMVRAIIDSQKPAHTVYALQIENV